LLSVVEVVVGLDLHLAMVEVAAVLVDLEQALDIL
jgi:hypothetical protein